MPPRSNLVAVLAYNGVSAFELGIAIEAFGLSNMTKGWYRVLVCADLPGIPRAATGGVQVVASAGLECLRHAGTIVVPGWHEIDAVPPLSLMDSLRRSHKNGARIVSICSGVFILAAAGLLDGRRVAAHWANAQALATRYPKLRVDPSVLYVDEGDILTSAGRAAGLDLCIHIIRNDYGAVVANEAARRLVVASHREGGQSQFIPSRVWTENNPFTGLRVWIHEHLDSTLTIAMLSAKVRMSQRTFIRRFKEAAGMSPGQWVLQERMTVACNLLETSALSVEQTATAVGFRSADSLRHHFRVRLGTSPAQYRGRFRL